MRYDFILFKDAPVRNILNNGRWEVPENYAYILSDIWEGLNRVEIDVTGEDEVIWKASTSGTFTMKSSYEEIRHHNPTWNYAQLIWFNGCIPSHSFITWLTFKGALKTQTKLKRWGPVAQSVCLFCWAEEETENHIFFACCYAKWIWEQLLQNLGFNRSTLNYNEEIQWVLSQIAERNNRVFNNVQTEAPSLLKNILSDVKLKLACSKTKLLDTAVNSLHDQLCWNTMGGFGAIIRIDEGRAIAACAGRTITKSMLYHELLSIKIGLELAIKYGKVKNEVNTKSTMAIPTEANQPALVLSRLRHELGYEEVRPTEFSKELKQKVKDDADGKNYFVESELTNVHLSNEPMLTNVPLSIELETIIGQTEPSAEFQFDLQPEYVKDLVDFRFKSATYTEDPYDFSIPYEYGVRALGLANVDPIIRASECNGLILIGSSTESFAFIPRVPSNPVSGQSRIWNDNAIWAKGDCLQRDDEEPIEILRRTIKKSPQSKVTRNKSLFDTVAQEGTELEAVLKELGINRKKCANSQSEKVQKSQETRRMASADGNKKRGTDEERLVNFPKASRVDFTGVPESTTPSKIVWAFPKKKMLKRGSTFGTTGSGEVEGGAKKRRVEPFELTAAKVIEDRPVIGEELKEIEERARLATLNGEEEMSKMAAHLIKGICLWAEEEKVELKKEKKVARLKADLINEEKRLESLKVSQEVNVIMADTYVEVEEDDKVHDVVVGVVDGLDGVSPQTVKLELSRFCEDEICQCSH
ncbi:hypothetical protein GIB67_035812 [Kingdonia uniflora]|uniref:Reverse transcriptase zinc-binding domain-containing protein n=1 Tax=Kingdonia uniflora TaxID=39325 RepID=A0A7J7MJH0_9MAGN|nr:hypothetical protein GIB67_035812 [Kingdonia uniflora]